MAYNAWDIFAPYLPGAATTTGSPSGTLAGSPARSGATPFGQVPTVPDPTGTQAEAITGNVKNLPDLTKMAGDINAFNLSQVKNMYTQAGLDPLLAARNANALAYSKGQIPDDVARKLQQLAAERGTDLGISGSPNVLTDLFTRYLGTSVDLTKLGSDLTSKAVSEAPKTDLFNLDKYLTNPNDLQNWKYLASVLNAAPDPAMSKMLDLIYSAAGRGQGYNTTRTPYQPPPGFTSDNDASVINDILKKYSPTVSPPTSGSPPPSTNPYAPPAPTAPPSPYDEEADWRYYIGGEGLPETVDPGYYTTPFGVPTPYPYDPAFEFGV